MTLKVDPVFHIKHRQLANNHDLIVYPHVIVVKGAWRVENNGRGDVYLRPSAIDSIQFAGGDLIINEQYSMKIDKGDQNKVVDFIEWLFTQ